MFIFLVAIIVIIDQFTKKLAIEELSGGKIVNIIDDFFRLVYVENSGAAFGIFKDARLFFILMTVFVLAFVLYIVVKQKKSLNKPVLYLLAVFCGGTIGNFIDRLLYGYVVDFLSFTFGTYGFPVFNIADIAITVSVLIFAFFVLTDKVDLDVK